MNMTISKKLACTVLSALLVLGMSPLGFAAEIQDSETGSQTVNALQITGEEIAELMAAMYASAEADDVDLSTDDATSSDDSDSSSQADSQTSTSATTETQQTQQTQESQQTQEAQDSKADSQSADVSQITDEEIAEAVDAMYASAEANDVDLSADDATSSDDSDSSSQTDSQMFTLNISDMRDLTGIIEFSGSTRYQTAALEALYACDSSEYVIIASGQSFPDALSAVSLAGALSCPILLTPTDSLSQYAADAIETLGSTEIIIVGGDAVVSNEVADELAEYGNVERLYGDTRFLTQMAIYNYGLEADLWNTGFAIVATGYSFADALSAAPLAYNLAAPIFLTDSDGSLTKEAAVALLSTNTITDALVVGGDAVVNERTVGILEGVTLLGGGSYNVTRVYGDNRYETSIDLANWAVDNGYLEWNKVAFATGTSPWDALAGSAIQGNDGSVLLLVSDSNHKSVYNVPQTGVDTVKFFGGTAAVSQDIRDMVTNRTGITNVVNVATNIVYQVYSISLSTMVDLEYAQYSESGSSYTRDEIYAAVDPSGYSAGDSGFYQFAVLSNGYSGMTASQLNAFIDAMCTTSEQSYGVTSILRGTGQYFIDAAKTYGINEVYLLAHAALETGWGCSTLAQGYVYDGSTVDSSGNSYAAGTYYNFFGIGAYDSSPLSGGRLMALRNGWNSVSAAILGGASWINTNYINRSSSDASGAQNTLYKMKWDVNRAVSQGSVWHQYATSLTWASSIASIMSNYYSYIGLTYRGTGLTFEVPRYQ